MAWLARQVRRAAASLLGDAPAPADADAAFFIGAPQDSWREALASILALGGGATAATPGEGAAQDRLIWVVGTSADGRIDSLEPLEQKGGTRGLGKAKAVSLATLVKRKDLAVHDAAVLRAVKREDYGNRPVLDIATAAQALVRHPMRGLAQRPDTLHRSQRIPAGAGDHDQGRAHHVPPARPGARRRCARQGRRRQRRLSAATLAGAAAALAPDHAAARR